MTRTEERSLLRQKYFNELVEHYKAMGEDVQIVASNKLAFPVVGAADSEEWMVFTATVPIGANKGTEPFDGYAEAENYQFKLAEKARKAKEKEKKLKEKEEKNAE